MLVGECGAGFELPALGLVVVSEKEIFGAQRRRLRRPLFRRGAAISAFTDLEPNDLVVHEDHGIGRYTGLRTLSSAGRDADFLLVEYAEGGRLYLPVERLDLITKYMGAPAGAQPASTAWGAGRGSGSRSRCERRCGRWPRSCWTVRRRARRGGTPDVPPPMTPWQRNSRRRSSYEETPDQMRAIEESRPT